MARQRRIRRRQLHQRRLYLYNRRGELAPADFTFSVSRPGRVPVKIVVEPAEAALAHAAKSCWPHPKGRMSFYADGSKKEVPSSNDPSGRNGCATAICVTWRHIPNGTEWDECVVKTFWLKDNNAAEVFGAYVAVMTAIDESAWDPEIHTIIIYTDSKVLLNLLKEFDRTDDGEWVVLSGRAGCDVRELWRLVDALDTLVHKCGKKVEMHWVPAHVKGESYGHWLADQGAKSATAEMTQKMAKSGPTTSETVRWYLYCHE